MTSICLVAIVILLYILLLSLYAFFTIKYKDDKMVEIINKKIYIASIVIAMCSLGACIFFIISTHKKIEFTGAYIALLIIYIYFTNLFKSLKNITEYTCIGVKRFTSIFVTEIIIFILNYKLDNCVPIENIVLNRVFNVFLIISLIYTLKSFILLRSKNNRIINLYFDNCINIYLCIFSIKYLLNYNSQDIIGLILVSISIIININDKVDLFIEYLSFDENIKDVKET